VNDKDENILKLIKRLSGRDFWGSSSESKELQTWLGQGTRCADMNTTREFEIFYEIVKHKYISVEDILERL
jgi:hypothetical protein